MDRPHPVRRVALLPLVVLLLAAAPDPKSLDAQLQALRAAKPADRPPLAQALIADHIRLADSLLADHKYPAAVDALRKARGYATIYVPGPAGQQLGGELDVRLTVAQWREKNDGRGLRAEFFDGGNFDTKVAERVDPKIDFPWERAMPTPELKNEQFTARWSGFLIAPRPGTYKLIAHHDDGCRVFIDDAPLIDTWERGAHTSETFANLTGRPQAIRVELLNVALPTYVTLHWVMPGDDVARIIPPEAFFTDKDAAARLVGKPLTLPRGFGLAGEYFDGDFGRRVFARVDPDLNFLLFRAHVHPAMGLRFTARWTGFLRAPEPGRYRLVANVDDGCRVSIDNRPVLSHWRQVGVWDTVTDLTGKPQTLVVEYINSAGDARFNLSWQRLGQGGAAAADPLVPIPPSAFFTDKTTAQYAPTTPAEPRDGPAR
jgi:hypothetical protein